MKRGIKGYMTVEISLLFPIILLVLFTLFYMCFGLHDKVVLNSSIGMVDDYKNLSEVTEDEVRNRIKESLNDRMLISDVLSVEYADTQDRIDIWALIRINIPLILWDNEEYQAGVSVECPDKSKKIRKYRIIREVVD